MKLGEWIAKRLALCVAKRFDRAAEAIEIDLLLPWHVYPAGSWGAEMLDYAAKLRDVAANLRRAAR